MLPPEAVDVLIAGTGAECRFVTVPADWTEPDGDQIEIATYRLESRSSKPALDPVVFLDGGPGGAAVRVLKDFASGSLRFLRDDRDIIVVDQRGTGYSQPALYCKEGFPEDPRVLSRCAQRWSDQGVNFDDYNSANNARDIDAVVRELGYERWNLFGVSYGARLALTMMRDTPAGIRAVILDSVFPLQVNGLDSAGYSARWALGAIVENCAADDECTADVADLIEQGVRHIESGEPFIGLPASDYLEILSNSVADPTVVAFIEAVAAGDGDTAATWLVRYFEQNEDIPGSAEIPEQFLDSEEVPQAFLPLVTEAAVMAHSVICAEELDRSGEPTWPPLVVELGEATLAASEAIPAPADPADCTIFDVTPAPPIEDEAVTSSIATLVIAGTADSVTPPTWSRLVAATLTNSVLLEIVGGEHGLLGFNQCAKDTATAFLNDPATPLDLSCAAAIPPITYEPSN